MINKVTLLGNLGKDPETKDVNGNQLTRFSLATSETYKKDGERVTQTEWHNVSLWGKQAEIAAKYLTKGSLIYLEGKIRTRSYEKEGQKVYATEIVGDSFKMLKTEKAVQTTVEPEQEYSNDLPF